MPHPDPAKIFEDLRTRTIRHTGRRAPSFAQAAARGRAHLPRRARALADELAELEARMTHPKLARRTDPAHLGRLARRYRASLGAIAPGQVRARARSLLAAEIGFRVFVVLAASLAVMHWLQSTP